MRLRNAGYEMEEHNPLSKYHLRIIHRSHRYPSKLTIAVLPIRAISISLMVLQGWNPTSAVLEPLLSRLLRASFFIVCVLAYRTPREIWNQADLSLAGSQD